MKMIWMLVCCLGMVVSSRAAISRNGAWNDTSHTLDKVFFPVYESFAIDSVIDFGKTFLNKPYKYKVQPDWPMDCSGFLAYIFSHYGYKIPRSSPSIGDFVQPIDLADIRKGDLIFFKGRNISKSSIGHVSLVIESNQDNIKMMHSCKRGIIIENYEKNLYYTKRFLKAGRMPFFITDTQRTSLVTHSNKVVSSPTKDTISLIGVGDMMLGTNYPSDAYLPPQGGKNVLSDTIKQIIASADISFGNMEGVLLSAKGTSPKPCKNSNTCYAFKMPDEYAYHFKDAGFDILSIANNHVGDFGEQGRNNTMNVLDKAGIYYAGLTKCPFTIFEKEGITYGFVAFSPNHGTNNINNIPSAVQMVKHLDSLCDIVIVSMHVGAEGAKYTHVTQKNEIFLKENRGNPYKFARAVIDAGADVVFGHGPHVTRAIDLYKNKFIAYSMGNFATYGRFSLSGVSGLAPIISLKIDRKGNFLQGKIYPIRQVGQGIPRLDADKAVIGQIIKLTKADIPNSPLTITTSGIINVKKKK